MNTTFAPRTGFCVWAGNTNYSEDSITLRLPKGDDKYYYYNAGDTPLGMSVTIDRPSDYYKLAFIDETWSNVPTISIFDDSQTLGLTGNPFMTTLYMKPFFAANTTLTGSYWIVKDKTIEACTASGESTTGSTDAVNIPPMQGFFVEVESGNEFSPSNLTFTSAISYPTTTSQTVASSLKQISRLRITALYGNYESKALLIENPLSRTDYYPKEDVPIVVLSESMTPSSLYTVGGNRALQINAMPQIEQVPVVLRLNNTNNYGATFKLTFTGSNSFDGTLLLLDVMTNKTYTITEGTELLLDVPNDQTWRYFITHARTNTELDQTKNNDAIQIFTPETNVAMIVSLKEITKITV